MSNPRVGDADRLRVCREARAEQQRADVRAERKAPPEVPVHAAFTGARYLTPKLRAFIELAVEQSSPAGRGRLIEA